MSYHCQHKIMFKHCDPAGIVFYPRYFEMINDSIELFFGDALNLPFEELVKTAGLPTAKIETTFTAPSLLGDLLDFTVRPIRIGTSSLSVEVTAHCGDELRLRSLSTLVYIMRQGGSQPWPDTLRTPLTEMIGGLT